MTLQVYDWVLPGQAACGRLPLGFLLALHGGRIQFHRESLVPLFFLNIIYGTSQSLFVKRRLIEAG